MRTKLSILLVVFSMTNVFAKQKISYPQTRMEAVSDTYFGVKVNEPYRWLEDDKSAETMDWVKKQNAVTYNYLAQIPFRDALKARIKTITNYPKISVPSKKKDFYYFYKNDGLQNQSVLYRSATDNGEAELILDPNKLSTDGTVALNSVEISKDGRYLAYSIARSGSDWNEIYVIDLATKQLMGDVIKWVKFSGIAWQGDGFYYSAYDAPVAGTELSGKNEYHKIYYHAVGQDQKSDKLIFEDREHALRNCGAGVSDDQKYLFVTQTETTTGNSLYFKDLTKVDAPVVPVVTGFDSDYHVVDYINGKVYVLTNDGAPNQRLIAIDPANPQKANWSVVIPEGNSVLESVEVAGGLFIAKYIENASNHLYVYDMSGARKYEIQLPTIGTVASFAGSIDDKTAYYSFTSYTYPPTVYKINLETNTQVLFRKAEVAFNPDEYVTEQKFYVSKDGTKVPMFITHKKGIKLNGQNPVMLYGYGGFNISLNPGFNTGRIPFIEKGGVYVVANIRGGGEFGEKWHLAGTKMNKQNVFDDFIAAGEFLIKEGYTSPKKLAINGGSNGGLLIGACLTQRPDLFAVAIPEVGVLDMLRYQKFTIGWAWATDYGTSEESAEMFRYLLGYSPLHNVKAGVKYPATMVMTGDHDDRVVPAHSFKFAATLQAANKGNYVSLIRIDEKAGHGAGKPIGKLIDAQGDMWAFVMYNLGMKF